MAQSVLEGLCAARTEITGVAFLEPGGLALASAGSRAHEARQAGVEALGVLKPNHRMTVEAEHGWVHAERLDGGELLLILTDEAPNLGGLLVEVQRCCGLLSR